MAWVMARMCDSVNVLSQRRSAVPAGAEVHALARVGRIGPVGVNRRCSSAGTSISTLSGAGWPARG